MDTKNMRAFTLIEILTVIAIICILIGLLSPALRSVREQARIDKTKAMIASLEVAVNMYYTDLGSYPTEVSGSNSFNSSLGTMHTVNGVNYGPYMEFKSSEVSVNAVLDPWTISYRYTQPSATQNAVHIWSCGPDKTGNTSDDIKNW